MNLNKVVVVLEKEKAPKKVEKNVEQMDPDQAMILQQLKAEVKECLQLANNIGERIKKVEETIA